MSLLADLRARFRRRPAPQPLAGSQAEGLLEEFPESARDAAATRMIEPKPLTPAEELVRLVRHVDHHLESQAERTERLTEALNQVPERLESLPELCRAHTRLLEALQDHAEADHRDQARILDLLDRLGAQGERQNETAELLAQHLEVAEARRDRELESASALRRSLESLAESQRKSGEAIAAAGQATVQREAALVAAFERMHGWLVATVVIAGFSAIAAATVAGLVFFGR